MSLQTDIAGVEHGLENGEVHLQTRYVVFIIVIYRPNQKVVEEEKWNPYEILFILISGLLRTSL